MREEPGSDSEKSTSSLDMLAEAAERSPRGAEKKLCVRTEEEVDSMSSLFLPVLPSSSSSSSSSRALSSHSLFSAQTALLELGAPPVLGAKKFEFDRDEISNPKRRG